MSRESLLAAAWRINRGFPLLIAALFLLNILAALFTAWHLEPRVAQVERRSIEQQEKLHKDRQSVAAAATPQSIWRQGEEDLKTFRAQIPPKVGFTALLAELSSIADKTGLAIERITYEPNEIPERNLLRYGLTFSVAGTYGQLKRFIFALEQSPRLIIIEDISLGESTAESGTARVTLRMRLSTFFTVDAT